MTHTLPTIPPRVEPYRCAPPLPPRAIAQRFRALGPSAKWRRLSSRSVSWGTAELRILFLHDQDPQPTFSRVNVPCDFIQFAGTNCPVPIIRGMDELLMRADRAIRDSELILRQVDENLLLARWWNARLLRTVNRSREETTLSSQSRAERGAKVELENAAALERWNWFLL